MNFKLYNILFTYKDVTEVFYAPVSKDNKYVRVGKHFY